MQFIHVDIVGAASTRTITQRVENSNQDLAIESKSFADSRHHGVQQSDDQLRLPMYVFCPLKDRQTTLPWRMECKNLKEGDLTLVHVFGVRYLHSLAARGCR